MGYKDTEILEEIIEKEYKKNKKWNIETVF